MKKREGSFDPAGRLSSQAEGLLKEAQMEESTGTQEDAQRLLHELQVHQIELETQNEELRQARDEVEVLLAKYSDLYDFAPVGYFTLDGNAMILQVNLPGALLLGTDRARLVKRRFDTFVADRSRPDFKAFMARVFADREKQTCELLLLNEKKPLHVRIEAIAIESGKECLAIVIDITELREIDNALKAVQERYHQLFKTTHDGILIIEAETGLILDVNPFLMEMLGYSHVDFLGKKLWEIGAFKDVLASKSAFVDLQAEGHVRYENMPLETSDGRLIAVEFVSNTFQTNDQTVIQCNIRDITERKTLADALRKSRIELEQRVADRTIELRTALSEIQAMKDQLEAENIYFRTEDKIRLKHDRILGQSDGLKYVLYRAEQVAPTNATVLILGETGTGKELIAAAIHNMSSRKDRPMITVNCAALPVNLIESELFGREKGAFTGADTRQIGRFEIANGSTLCLDEIGELPLEMQSKLLRVIQHSTFERLGSSQTIKVDVRLLATTNRNLEEEVRKGRFREDLFYRLNVFPVTVPPLRQRTSDIPLLVQSFVDRYSRKLGKQITSISNQTLHALQVYAWPGNIRELESVIERALILCPGPVFQLTDKLDTSLPTISSSQTLEETERNQILKTLSENRWRIEGKGGSAEILAIHPSTLRARMHKLGIVRPRAKESD